MSMLSCTLLNPIQASREAISEGLDLPKPSSDGRINTLNNHGAMKFKYFSATAKKFIEIASRPETKVLDIGAAFGETCLEALKRGSTDYTAIDIEPKHLKILARRVYEEIPDKINSVKLIAGGIPNQELNEMLVENSYDAILLDSVLHFLDQKEIVEATRQVFSWLKPGGKVFASMGTYYVSIFRPQAREYLDRQIQNFLHSVESNEIVDPSTIPGFNEINENASEFLEEKFEDDFRKALIGPTKFFSFQRETAKYFFEQAGFIVDDVFYTTIDGFKYKLDGREYVAVIASKSE